MNVLSLFDGMSCGQIALNKLGIKVDNYFACEIDKFAIKIAQKNFPDTVQLGSVTDLIDLDLMLPEIDLIIGGSPCQSFSFAGKRKGMSTTCNIEVLSLDQYLELKSENFVFEGQSYLFWEYLRLLNEVREINPDVKFLLENVNMAKKWKAVISENLEVEPVFINSTSFSAQSRPRLYWTNIPVAEIPENETVIKDILSDSFSSDLLLENNTYWDLTIKKGGTRIDELLNNYRDIEDLKNDIKLVSVITGDTPSNISRQGDRIYSIEGKSPCLTTSQKIKIDSGGTDVHQWRFLSATEHERLQTVPEGYTEGVSEAQRYRMLGNGWTVDVIAHIFKNLINNQ